MPKIIGITGLAGHGKDTVAQYLGAALGDSTKLTFADPIRKIAADIGLDVIDRDKKEVIVSRRFGHFELSLIEAIMEELEDYCGEDDLCDLYASFVTILRSSGYLTTSRQDVLSISPRRFCQLLGTEGGRAVRPTFWVDVFRARAAKVRSKYVVAPDVRFANEAAVCDVLIGVRRPSVFPVEPHASEKEIPELVNGAHVRIRNDGTLAYLKVCASVVSVGIKYDTPHAGYDKTTPEH